MRSCKAQGDPRLMSGESVRVEEIANVKAPGRSVPGGGQQGTE